MTEPQTPAAALLAKPIVDWQSRLECPSISAGHRQDLESELSALIQRAVLLEAYVSRRFNTGCGDQGHATSAKHARATLVKVRRALGYSYPANTPAHIP